MESLVSICVVSYNSAGTILETLDSIKGQTYKNIELIISDDNSKDNTVEIATEWLKNNSNRFTNTQLLTVEKNSGVTGNCNRAVKASKGEIVKIIAADDIFYPDYIESCTEYFLQNPECNVLFTKLTPFLENDKTDVISLPEDYDFLQLTQQEQHDRLIYNGLTILPTPACIYRKKILEQDQPYW